MAQKSPITTVMLKNQLLFALRRLGRHKLNTTINILGLTLGVLACLVIFLFVSFEFSYDKGRPRWRPHLSRCENIYPSKWGGRSRLRDAPRVRSPS